jgi:hypothetical protein
MASKATVTVLGDDFEVAFNRRRYGTTTFTWAYLVLGDEWLALYDPWPAVTWPRAELERAVERKLEEVTAA